ncbi:hypothetical protein H5410_060946 [Solanum commersonii]|uniref:RNase H type-1 domain-containing protein n=1 Tax=Solanum commersonii TaxID=4109 RepID=A0A9J5W7H7_SOLCO|nr:hypothetical protein H5410_060946 [Solanum commersonii]
MIWNYFSNAAGLHGPWVQLKQTVQKRNIILHGGRCHYEKVIVDINDTIHKFTCFTFPFFQKFSKNCSQMVVVLENWKPSYSHRIVKWSPPPSVCDKYNTDGASKGNPGPSSAAFYGKGLPESINLVVEAVAIKEGIEFCIKEI